MNKHLELTPTKGLSEAQWQELRRSFSLRGMIGGSDAGALLGLDGKYRSPITLYYDALGLSGKEVKMNEVMLHGKLLEGHIANLWQYWSGDSNGMVLNFHEGVKVRSCREYKYIAVNPRYPHLFANIDRLITKHPTWGKTKGVLEIKTIRSSVSDMYTLGVPPKYMVQCQEYMMVYDLPYAEIAYLKDGSSVNVLTFESDKELQQRIEDAAAGHSYRVTSAIAEMERFNEQHGFLTEDDARKIAMEYEPEADGLISTEGFFSDRHQSLQNTLEIMGSDTHYGWGRKYKEFDAAAKEAEEQKLLYRTKLQQFMQKNGANSIVFPDDAGTVNWRKIFKVNI